MPIFQLTGQRKKKKRASKRKPAIFVEEKSLNIMARKDFAQE